MVVIEDRDNGGCDSNVSRKRREARKTKKDEEKIDKEERRVYYRQEKEKIMGEKVIQYRLKVRKTVNQQL